MAAVNFRALRLEIRPALSARFRPLIPLQAKPFKAGEYFLERLWLESLLVGVFDAQDKGTALMAGEQKIEQRRAGAADMQIAGG